MSTSKDLYLAILSMDAYNQGYGAGINTGASQIGNAVKLSESDIRPESDAVAASFYAVAYSDPTYGTIISYRGTDQGELVPVDLAISYGGSYNQAQIALAQKYFDAVDGSDGTSAILLTGHSLGGAPKRTLGLPCGGLHTDPPPLTHSRCGSPPARPAPPRSRADVTGRG